MIFELHEFFLSPKNVHLKALLYLDFFSWITPIPTVFQVVNESTGTSFEVICRFDTELELTYNKHGGILNYMIRKVVS